ncbi:ATP phosphoribosyltransferase [Candidatus Daviesbacteria bacterium]|nr:ATP phosphoribosyltransferase [Candidatus Daviesbacteria bacterium]
MSTSPERLGVLIPSGKHILRGVINALGEKGIQPTHQKRNGNLYLEVDDPPVTLTAQHSFDVLRQVDSGIYVAGIVGSDRVAEYLAVARVDRNPLPGIEELGRLEVFHPAPRLSILVGEAVGYRSAADLANQRIVTSYRGLTEEWFNDRNIEIALDRVEGKEEIQVFNGRAEAAVVLVSSGATMRRWRLRELAVMIDDVQPVLIYNPLALRESGEQELFNQFMARFRSGGATHHTPDFTRAMLDHATPAG